jgi:opacity protein-like surface antigen
MTIRCPAPLVNRKGDNGPMPRNRYTGRASQDSELADRIDGVMCRSKRERLCLILLAVSCITLCARPAGAQQLRTYEVSAGYAYMRVDSSAGGLSLHGISFLMARNLNRWLAIAGDGGGYHLEGFRLGTVQAGPRFTARGGHRFSAFAQTLVGFAHANAGARGFPTYDNSVAWTAGGGLDWRFGERVSLRLGQIDYVQTRLGGAAQNNLRAGAGVVFHFGSAR